MKREIKFRAWNEKYKCMVEVGAIDFLEEKIQLGSFEYRLDRFPIMQYTGLKDRNGKEIYEGDVVKTSWYNQPLEVIYLEYQFLFEIKANVNYKYVSFDNFEWPDDFEVIGNIYDNPDLLEG